MAKSALTIISFILNIIYVAAAILLVIASVSYYMEFEEIKHVRNKDLHVISSGMSWTEMVPYILISVGVFVAIVSLCGFGGAYSKAILVVYITFLTVAVVASTTATIIVSENADCENTDKVISDIIQEGVKQIDGKIITSARDTAFGNLEKKYTCCGSEHSDDYLNFTAEKFYPKSCCRSDRPCLESSHGVTVKILTGCKKVVIYKTRLFIKHLWWGGASVSAIGFVNLVVAVLALVLKGVKDQKKEERRNVQETQLNINGVCTSVNV